MPGKRRMFESVVEQGVRMTRILCVKLDCLNPNPDGVKCAPIGRTLGTDDTLCIGMNRGLVHSLNVNGDQRGLSRDESGRYGRASTYHNDVPRDHLNRASGKVTEPP